MDQSPLERAMAALVKGQVLSPPEGGNPYAQGVRTALSTEQEPGYSYGALLPVRRKMDEQGEPAAGSSPELALLSAGPLGEMTNMYRQFADTMKGKEFTPEDAMKMAANIGIGGMSVSPKAGPGTTGMFMGRGALNFPIDKYWDFVMREGSEDAGKLWEELGFFRNPHDTESRFEISDKDAAFQDPNWAKNNPGVQLKLGDVLAHKELLDNYPEFSDYKVISDPSLGMFTLGSFDNSTKTIRLNPSRPVDEQLSTILHEIQHGIQSKEGFAEGGNPGMFPPAELQRLTKNFFDELAKKSAKEYEEFNKLMADPKYQAVLRKRMSIEAAAKAAAGKIPSKNKQTGYDKPQYKPGYTPEEEALLAQGGEIQQRIIDIMKRQMPFMDDFSAYQLLGGEVEARLTQARQAMDMSERSKSFPPEHMRQEGYPLENHILRGNGINQFPMM